MKLSIQKKILLVVANALVLMIAMAGVMSWQFNSVRKNKATITLNAEALRSQMEADMMHDALRGDVLAALHAAHLNRSHDFAGVHKALEEHVAIFREDVKSNQECALAPEITTALRSVSKPLDEYIIAANKLVETASKDVNAAEALWPAFSEAFAQLEDAMGKVNDTIEANVKSVNEASAVLYTQFYLTVFISLGLAVASLSFISWRVTRSIVTALDKVGDELNQSASQLNASSNEVSSSSQTLAESASQQAASLEETSASLEEIAAMTKRNAESASNASRLGSQASQSATAGGAQITELNRTLNTIKAAVGEMQAAVHEMQSSSQQVAKIIKTIDEIAFQTNLLALNAAVEAARAGEAGMGFAVVADEVRALAQRSAQAAKDTSEKIESAVKRSELGGVASANVVKSLSEVEITAQNIQQVFAGISTQIKSLDQIISQIAAASQEQTAGINEVNMAVSQLDKVTQSNAAGAEENASSAQILKQQSTKMLHAVEDLHVIVTGRPNTASQSASSFSNVPNDRDNAAFAFGAAASKSKKLKTPAVDEFQNF